MLAISNTDYSRQFGHVRPAASQRLKEKVLNLSLQFLDFINYQHWRRFITLNGFTGVSKGVKKFPSFKELFRPHKRSCCLWIRAVVNQLFNSLLLSSHSPAPKHFAGCESFHSGNVKEG